MAVAAITDDYTGDRLDSVDKFHGNQLVYIGWDYHLMFCSPFAFPLPPDMPFGALIADVIPSAFSQHPDFESINWDEAQWLLNGETFEPNPEASLIDQGIDHKSVIRFRTPGLDGIQGTGT